MESAGEGTSTFVDYKIIPKLDQEEVFSTVANKLLQGQSSLTYAYPYSHHI